MYQCLIGSISIVIAKCTWHYSWKLSYFIFIIHIYLYASIKISFFSHFATNNKWRILTGHSQVTIELSQNAEKVNKYLLLLEINQLSILSVYKQCHWFWKQNNCVIFSPLLWDRLAMFVFVKINIGSWNDGIR